MGLIKKLLKRDLTPEEQERKSQREREWTEKCVKAGERFGERIGIRDKVDAVNKFGNKYPRTFFGIIFGIIGVSFVLNILLSTGNPIQKSAAELGEIRIPKGDPTMELMQAMKDSIRKEVYDIDKQIKHYLALDSLTHADSLEVKKLLLRLKNLQEPVNRNQEQE